MIVVCIKKGGPYSSDTDRRGQRDPGSLTVGKQYEVVSTRASYILTTADWDLVEDDQYVILNDYGVNYPYCMSYFISLEDFRNNQIEKVINV